MSDREQYPGAPAVQKGTEKGIPTPEALKRREWVNRRNAAIQGGPPPDPARPRRPLPAFAKKIKKGK